MIPRGQYIGKPLWAIPLYRPAASRQSALVLVAHRRQNIA